MASSLSSQTVRLKPHAATPCQVLDFIEVAVGYEHPRLVLEYRLSGRMDLLAVPETEEPVRTVGLWEETCCEALLMPVGGKAYYEFNLSPSSQWAVFDFSDYRENSRQLDVGRAPVVDCEAYPEKLVLRAIVDLSMLPAEARESDWQIGLSCVVRAKDDAKSYWALAHPPEKPDFHDSNCFTLTLKAANRA